MKIDPTKPIEAVNVQGMVLPARLIATDAQSISGRVSWIGLVLEEDFEAPFRMDPDKDYGYLVSSGRIMGIRNLETS